MHDDKLLMYFFLLHLLVRHKHWNLKTGQKLLTQNISIITLAFLKEQSFRLIPVAAGPVVLDVHYRGKRSHHRKLLAHPLPDLGAQAPHSEAKQASNPKPQPKQPLRPNHKLCLMWPFSNERQLSEIMKVMIFLNLNRLPEPFAKKCRGMRLII